MRKVHETQPTSGNKQAKVYYDHGNMEYIVRLYVAGEYQPQADYFTDEKQDAIDTAAAMVRGGVSCGTLQ